MPLSPADDLAGLRAVLGRAQWAARAYGGYGRDSVERIVDQVALAGSAGAQDYAVGVVTATGRGIIGDKSARYGSCITGLREAYRGHDYVSARSGASPGVVEIPRPAGVVLALMPAEGVVTAVLSSCFIALLTRNALVLGAHPADPGWCGQVAGDIRSAAIASGAPDGIIDVVAAPVTVGDGLLIGDERIAMVIDDPKSSGSIPVLVDASADLARTAACLVSSKSFDNSSEGISESVLIAVDVIFDDLLAHMGDIGAYLLSGDESDLVRRLLFPAEEFDSRWRGIDALGIASEIGAAVPPNTRVLLAEIDFVRSEEMLSHEKPCPVLGVVRVGSVDSGIQASRAALRASGATCAVVHSHDEQNVMNFGSRVGVRRVVVNAGLNPSRSLSWPIELEAEDLLRWTRVDVGEGSGFVDLSRLCANAQGPVAGGPSLWAGQVPPYPMASNLPHDA